MTVPGKGKVSVVATRGATKVASGTRAVAGGRAPVKLTFTRPARRSLKRMRKVKLALKVTFTPAGGTAQVTTGSLTLKR